MPISGSEGRRLSLRGLVRGLAALAAVALGLTLAASFAGALHPAGDALAVFRLPLAVALTGAAALAMATGARRWPAALALAALAAQAPMLASRLSAAPAPGALVHYQKNLLFRLPTPGDVLADIAAVGPDTITLQEVSERNVAAVLDVLAQDNATVAFCPFTGVGGVAAVSRWPALGPPLCAGGRGDGMVAVQLDAPGGPLWLVSVHLHWPWPHGQAEQAERLLARLAALEGPVLVGGDFNMVPWSSLMGRFEAVTGNPVARGAPITFRLPPGEALPLRLAIDHVLAPGSGALDTRPLAGSDHYGLVLRWDRSR